MAPEFAGDSDGYIRDVCETMIPALAAALCDAVDAFCETIGFTPAQTRRVFEAAKQWASAKERDPNAPEKPDRDSNRCPDDFPI